MYHGFCSLLWIGAILKDMSPLMCDLQHAAVLRSKPPAAGCYKREGVVAPIVEWYTRDHEIGKSVVNIVRFKCSKCGEILCLEENRCLFCCVFLFVGRALTQVLVDINRSYMYWWCLVPLLCLLNRYVPHGTRASPPWY